jgi:hypothetical protein
MNLRRSPLVLAGLASLAVAAGFLGSENEARASSGADPIPYLDDDGDGLDNAIEQRLAISYTESDIDDDTYSDLTEIIARTDPLTPDAVILPNPSIRLECYATASHLAIQVWAHYQVSVDMVLFHVANSAGPAGQYFTMTVPEFLPYVNRSSTIPSQHAGYWVTSVRIMAPLSYFESFDQIALAVEARLDGGIKVADEIRLEDTWLSGLTEWREVGQQGGGQGGLFPANPGITPPPEEFIENQVCIQELSAQGAIGGAGVLYTVTAAQCDSMLQAFCATDCALSTGGSVIGIDIASLIN